MLLTVSFQASKWLGLSLFLVEVEEPMKGECVCILLRQGDMDFQATLLLLFSPALGFMQLLEPQRGALCVGD